MLNLECDFVCFGWLKHVCLYPFSKYLNRWRLLPEGQQRRRFQTTPIFHLSCCVKSKMSHFMWVLCAGSPPLALVLKSLFQIQIIIPPNNFLPFFLYFMTGRQRDRWNLRSNESPATEFCKFQSFNLFYRAFKYEGWLWCIVRSSQFEFGFGFLCARKKKHFPYLILG